MDAEDSELIVRAKSGDDEAFADLLRKYLTPVYRFAYRLVGNDAEAEDVASEVFVKAWKKLSSFRIQENFKTWLFVITRNTAYDHLRKRGRQVELSLDEVQDGVPLSDTIADDALLPDELFAQQEDILRLDNALQQLPILYREVILLHAIEGLTFDEVGKLLNRPMDTVKSQYRRGLVSLRALLDAPK